MTEKIENNTGYLESTFRSEVLPIFGNAEQDWRKSDNSNPSVVTFGLIEGDGKVTYGVTATYDSDCTLLGILYKKTTQLTRKTTTFEIEVTKESFRINFPACDDNSDLSFSFESDPTMNYTFCKGRQISYSPNSGLATENLEGFDCDCFNGAFYKLMSHLTQGGARPEFDTVVAEIMNPERETSERIRNQIGLHLLNASNSLPQMTNLLPEQYREQFSSLAKKEDKGKPHNFTQLGEKSQ